MSGDGGASGAGRVPLGAASAGGASVGGQGGVGGAVEELLSQVAAEPGPEPALEFPIQRGRVALITGGSSGIGRATAIGFAGAGVHIAFNYLDTGAASRRAAVDTEETLKECGVRVFARSGDVRDSAWVRDFVSSAHEQLGGLHFLVNNAGVGRDRALWRMSDEEWASVIDTNLTGSFYFTREVAPYLREQEFGKIVNVSSVHGMSSEFGLANYCSSKAGMIGLTRSTAVELGPSNVNVNAVAPGYIRTTRLTERVPAEILDRARELSVLGRLGDPQDVVSVILFLCSEMARHITGAVIPIDGGYLI